MRHFIFIKLLRKDTVMDTILGDPVLKAAHEKAVKEAVEKAVKQKWVTCLA